MISRTWNRKALAFCLAATVLSVYSMVVLAAPFSIAGELSVTGQVTVNGQSAVSGSTVFTDSVITTSDNSSATISLGKLGRVELMPNSSLKLSFSDTGLVGTISAGRVRVSSLSGTSALINGLDGSAVADASQSSTFIVDVTCGNLQVATQVGNVTLRSVSGEKQVAAGKDASAGSPQAGTRCTRLAGANSGTHTLSSGAIAAIILAAGGAVVGAVVAGTGGSNNSNTGGGTTVVSPTR